MLARQQKPVPNHPPNHPPHRHSSSPSLTIPSWLKGRQAELLKDTGPGAFPVTFPSELLPNWIQKKTTKYGYHYSEIVYRFPDGSYVPKWAPFMADSLEQVAHIEGMLAQALQAQQSGNSPPELPAVPAAGQPMDRSGLAPQYSLEDVLRYANTPLGQERWLTARYDKDLMARNHAPFLRIRDIPSEHFRPIPDGHMTQRDVCLCGDEEQEEHDMCCAHCGQLFHMPCIQNWINPLILNTLLNGGSRRGCPGCNQGQPLQMNLLPLPTQLAAQTAVIPAPVGAVATFLERYTAAQAIGSQAVRSLLATQVQAAETPAIAAHADQHTGMFTNADGDKSSMERAQPVQYHQAISK